MRKMLNAIDARTASHFPCPLANGPYTVIRSKTVVVAATNAVDTCILSFGSFKDAQAIGGITQGPPWCTPILGYLTYTNLARPEVFRWIPDSYLSGSATNAYNLSLHALTVEVRCYSTPTTAGGDFYLGTLRQNFSRRQQIDYPSMASTFIGTRQAKHYSCYEATLAPRVAHSCPMDMVNYASMDPIGPTPLGSLATTGFDVTMDDAMSPIVCVIPPGAASLTFNIYAEWRTINNVDRAIADMAKVHPVTNPNHWQSLVSAVHEHGGNHDALMSNLSKGADFMTGAMHLAGVVAPLLAA